MENSLYITLDTVLRIFILTLYSVVKKVKLDHKVLQGYRELLEKEEKLVQKATLVFKGNKVTLVFKGNKDLLEKEVLLVAKERKVNKV